jgi:hypothetical protein
MSVEAMSRVLNHSTLTGTAKLVLLGIANHEGDGGAFPKIETLMRYGNCSESSVHRAIRAAVEAGELVVEPRTRENGSSTSNRYSITVGGVPPVAPGGVPPVAPLGVPPVAPPEPPTNHPEEPPPLPVPTEPAARRRSGPAERTPGALMGCWVAGYQRAKRGQPHPSHRSRAGAGVKRAVSGLDLAALSDQDWLRLCDTAYILGTGNEFHLLDAFLGGGGSPRLPANNRYRMGSGGNAIAITSLNTDQPRAFWEDHL